MKRPWVYMSSPSRSPLPPPSPPAPSRSSQSTRSERLSHASNLGWWSVSPLIVYIFRCCSLETSHPCLLPQSLNDCSINLCLFFIYFGYKPLLDMTIANIFSISYIISHFIDGSPWQFFQVWCTHSCSLFLSLVFLLELLPNFLAKTDVQEQSTPSILGAKWFK